MPHEAAPKWTVGICLSALLEIQSSGCRRSASPGSSLHADLLIHADAVVAETVIGRHVDAVFLGAR